MTWLLLFLFLEAAAAQITGKIEFLESSMRVSESNTYVHFILLRTEGYSGNITAETPILPGTNATPGIDFLINPAKLFFPGTVDVQSQLVIVFNNLVWEPDKVIKLGLTTDPPEALGASNTLDIWITDDGDGGEIVVPNFNVAPEATISTTNDTNNTVTNESCAVWVTRQGISSGRAGLNVTVEPCSISFPQMSDLADYGQDYLKAPQAEPLMWESDESGRKCLIGILSEKIAEDVIFRGLIPPPQQAWIWINADGQVEQDEAICWKATLAPDSTASLTNEHFLLRLDDSGLDGGGKLRCVRGRECRLDLSSSSAIAYQYGFVQPAVEDGCTSCWEAWNNSNLTEYHFASFDFGMSGDVTADLGMQLKDFPPGTYSVCLCGIGLTGQVASMKLMGPRRRNTVFCSMHWPECQIAQLDAVDPVVGKDHLRVLLDCGDRPELTPLGLQNGAHGVLSANGFQMQSASEMRNAENGIYALCWCRETADHKCEQLQDYKADAGTFIYVGPNRINPTRTILGDIFEVRSVYGTGLSETGMAMLLPKCGERHITSQVNSTFDINKSNFLFGLLREEDGFLAREYRLCWCQPHPGTPVPVCDQPEHFLADIGAVKIGCPYRSVDLEGHGHCRPCPLTIQQAGGPLGEDCVLAVDRFLLSIVLLWLTTSLFLGCIGSFRMSWAFGLRLHGMPRKIEDISWSSDRLLITTVGLHNLIRIKRHPIPIILRDTGHYLLDSKPGKIIQLYAMPFGDMTLEIVHQNGSSVDFAADSSMGVLEVPFGRSLIHSTLPKCTVPLVLQLITLLAASISLAIYLLPEPWEVAFLIATALLLAIINLLIWKFVLRNSSTMNRKLQLFTKHKARDEKRITKEVSRGRDRGIRVWKILDLYEHFQSHIRDRNMYYLDPNIVRPLTASVQLSFAELVGPDEVEWFVSHWWGTSVATYCSALRRHAYEVKVKELGASSPLIGTRTISRSISGLNKGGDQSWANTTYWICTFSNNQYKIAEELGGGEHTQSSFYLALHSEGLKGTCMILDEMAMPLMRSWCLFELLQTIELEEKAQAENVRPFAGLLFCTSVGVLNYGSSTVEMSMKIGERLLDLSLRDAQATTEKDKKMIADLVQKSRGSFDEIDTVLRVHIRDALRTCQHQVNFDFTSLFSRLPTEEGLPTSSDHLKSQEPEEPAFKSETSCVL